MHILVPIVIILVLVGLIFYGLYFNKNATIRRRLKATPVKSIGLVNDGETVKVVGMVQFISESLIAPLSERPCCHYHIVVEQKVYSGKHLRWDTIIDEESSTRFLIEQNGKYAYPEPKGVKSLIVKDRNYELNDLSHHSPKLEDFLHKHGYKREKWSGYNVRYSEGIIEKGERIAIFGKAEWRSAESLDLPSGYDKILCITPDYKTNKILLSDDKIAISGV